LKNVDTVPVEGSRIARVTRREALGIAGGLVIGAAAAGLGVSALLPSTPVATTTVTETASTVTQTASAVASPQATIVALAAYMDDPFTTPIKASVPDAASMFNIDISIKGVPAGDMSAFADVFSATIAQKPDGIMIEELDPSLFPITQKAISEGIPVVSFVVDDAISLLEPHPSGRLSYIGTDMRQLANRVASDALPAINALNPPKGAEAAIFLHRPGAPDEEVRVTGYKDVLEAAGFTCTEHLAGPDTLAQAEPMVSSYLASHPGVVAAFGVDGIATPAVAEAIRALDLKDKVIGAGLDLLPETLTAVSDGIMHTLGNQQPYIALPQAAFTLLAYKLSKGLIIPWSSATGAGLVNKDNIASILENAHSKYVGA
jgi:ABC-type sugar transport system substrate-binding protein